MLQDLVTAIDAGGLVVLAAAVWYELRKLTNVMVKLSSELAKMSERQDTIMDRQREVAEGLIHISRGDFDNGRAHLLKLETQ